VDHGWNIDGGTWQAFADAASACQLSWHRVRFEAVWQDQVPAKAGIYAICSVVPGPRALLPPLYNAVYVGKSRDLRSRFLQHCATTNDALRRAVACFGVSLDFWYAVIPSHSIGRLEALLIDCLGPPVNRRREAAVQVVVRDPVYP
jgi:hypothetical protein